jgi:ATP-binding cassette subfamily B protein
VVEVGSHDELMAAQGTYWRLYEAQARNVDTEDVEPEALHMSPVKVAT